MMREREIMKDFNGLWDRLALKKSPVYSLRECLGSYDERMWQQLERTFGIERSKLEGKQERMRQLEAAIQQDMKRQLLYLTRRQAYFLLECTQKPYINHLSEAFGFETIFSLIDVGWIYWFEIGEEMCFVLPDELKRIVADTFFEDDTFSEQQKFYELSEYIEAFVHLYGVFEKDYLLDIWNQHHPKDLFTIEKLENYVRGANKRQPVFVSEGRLIYAADEFNLESALGLSNEVSELPYYRPKPEEIWPLAYKKTQDTVIYHQLEKYVRRWIPANQSKEILSDVLNFVRVGFLDKEVTTELVLDGLLDPTNNTFMNKFSFYYKKLSNDTRCWFCKGHKPCELKRVMDLQQNKIPEENIVPFPVSHER